ncbi:hypothetical protein ACH414_13585 [Streptomyces sp. NPDC020422]|uniref:hypothetical protein n=1 Tax=unclassified Streptomyces TaxID=2593676 RepID=UPI0036FA3434
MPQHEEHEEHDVTNGRFEEELGAVLRHAGDGFAAGDSRELVAGGLARGRRRLLRRRVAMAGGALALAAIGVGGVYGGALLGDGGGAVGAGGVDGASVAAGPKPGTSGAGKDDPAAHDPGSAQLPVAELAAVLKANTPAGTWEIQDPDGKGQGVTAVYDDGKGKAGVSVLLNRASGDGEAGAGQVTCPDPVAVSYDDCTTRKLADGSRLMLFQGYEYPDKRVETKSWRAVLLTKDGFLIDAMEYNAATEKDSPISRENPPFDPDQLKTLVTAEGWRPLLKRLPVPKWFKPGSDAPSTVNEPRPAVVQATLSSLLPEGVHVVSRGGDGGYAYLVVDDGKGKSLVQINVQPRMTGIRAELFSGSDVTVEADGTRVKLAKRAGEKGGEGVVWWSADTLAADDFRVIVSAFNSGTQHDAATRAEPALTTEQLKRIALSPKWRALTGKQGSEQSAK